MNPKKKGNHGENLFANWLKKEGICNAYRNSSSGSNERKSDVHNDINCNFEVKTVKSLNLKKAFKQSQADCRMTHATPYVVVHFDGMPENDWLMVMTNHDWKELIMKSEIRGDIIVKDSWDKTNAINKIQYAMDCLRQAKRLLNKDEE
jgi:Holliday junction resolvase